MNSIKGLQKEIDKLRLQAQGKHKEAQKIGQQIIDSAGDPLGVAGSVRQANRDNESAHELNLRANELDEQKMRLEGEVVEVEAQLAKLRDEFEADKKRLEADYQRRHDELENQRLKLLG